MLASAYRSTHRTDNSACDKIGCCNREQEGFERIQILNTENAPELEVIIEDVVNSLVGKLCEQQCACGCKQTNYHTLDKERYPDKAVGSAYIFHDVDLFTSCENACSGGI